MSLSARRAWIEIPDVPLFIPAGTVALRKESVDRNTTIPHSPVDIRTSLSARRAWIEITGVIAHPTAVVTSLSARRAWIEIEITLQTVLLVSGRSPQGERG